MCLSNLKDDKKQTTQEDITVLKVVKKNKGKLCSPVFDIEIWKIDEEKVVDFSIIKDGFEYPKTSYRTTTGLYSYDSSCDPKYCSLVFSYSGKDLEVYEAIIPAGSEYIKVGSQYCSNKLKLIKKIL